MSVLQITGPVLWQGRGWFRVGSGVTYHQSPVVGREGPPQYTLTFNLTLPHDCDVVHLAHCYPYSYTHLMRQAFSACPAYSAILCHTTQQSERS